MSLGKQEEDIKNKLISTTNIASNNIENASNTSEEEKYYDFVTGKTEMENLEKTENQNQLQMEKIMNEIKEEKKEEEQKKEEVKVEEKKEEKKIDETTKVEEKKEVKEEKEKLKEEETIKNEKKEEKIEEKNKVEEKKIDETTKVEDKKEIEKEVKEEKEKLKKRETEKEMFIRWLKECFADEKGKEGGKHKKLLKEKTNEVNKQIEDIVREYYVETKKGLDAYTYMDKSMDTYNKLWEKTKTAIEKMGDEMVKENFKNTKEKRDKQFEKEMEEIKEKRKQNKNTKISKQKINLKKNQKKI